MLMRFEQPWGWRQAGWVPNGRRRARVFEALVVLACAQCGRPIQPGELFSRVVVDGKRNLRLPVCRACRPVSRRIAWRRREEPASGGAAT